MVVRLVRMYRTELYSYAAVNVQYSSGHGKKDPKGNSEIIMASSLVSKGARASPGFQQARRPPTPNHGSQWGSSYLHLDFKGWSCLELHGQDS